MKRIINHLFIITSLLSFLIFFIVTFCVPFHVAHASTINKSASTTASGLTNTDLTNGLIAYYPFDGKYMTWTSSTAGTAVDASVNKYNGTLVNMNQSINSVGGKIGQALNFNSSTAVEQYINTNNYIIQSFPFSVCMWVNPILTGQTHMLIDQYNLQFYLKDNGSQLGLGFYNNYTMPGLTYGNIKPNVWNFACVTAGPGSSVATTTLYVNGSIVTGPTSFTQIGFSNQTTYIGYPYGGADPTAAKLDDIRIYNRALSAMEVQQLYQYGLTTIDNTNVNLTNRDLGPSGGSSSASGLTAYYPFSGQYMTWQSGTNTVGTSTDASGNGYNGTLINMNRTSSIVLGKVGQALSLNSTSTNSYVNVGATANNIKTVAFWFKPNSITQSILALSSTVNITTASDVLTATGFTSPTIYIDGVNSAANPTASTTVVSGWHFIVVTTATPINANAVTLGQVGTAYFSGILDDVRLYSRVLSAREVKQLYDMTGGTSPAGGGGSAGCGAHTITGPDGLTYGTVLGADGNCWLDRNLGATEVATSSTDWKSYGSLYQWGRLSDGHQLITWTNGTTGTPVNGTTITMSTTTTPINNLFILGSSTQANDWIYPPTNNTLWQGLRGINNPCPVGFAIPTAAQWVTLVADSNITNSASAFGSTLKLPEEGYRIFNSGGFNFVGTFGYYWSNSPSGQNAYYMQFNSTSVIPSTPTSRASGNAIRCVKD